MVSVKLRVLGGKGRNNKDLSFGETCSPRWRPGHRRFQMQLLGRQQRQSGAGQGQEGRACPSPPQKEATIKATQGGSLIEKSLILLSASELRKKDPTYKWGDGGVQRVVRLPLQEGG